MKVCQVNCVYGMGSTGKIVKTIHTGLLDNDLSSVVLVPLINEKYRNDINVFSFSNKILSKFSAIYRFMFGKIYDGAFFQTNKLIKYLKKEQPNIVHLHSINGNNINIYRLFKYLSKNKIPTVITMHAEFLYTGGCSHANECEQWKNGCVKCDSFRKKIRTFCISPVKYTWNKLNRFYSNFDKDKLIITSVSNWLNERVEQSLMLKYFRKYVVLNGLDTSVFHARKFIDNDLRKEFNLNSEKIVLFVTAFFYPDNIENAKGGNVICELAKRFFNKNLKFLIVSLKSQIINELPKNIIFIGKVIDQNKLASLYSCANLTIVTSKRETFSMPVAESLCCGTPVVGYKAGGPESIADSRYSEFSEYGNIDELECLISKWIDYKTNNNYLDISNDARNIYSNEKMIKEYLDLYRKWED